MKSRSLYPEGEEERIFWGAQTNGWQKGPWPRGMIPDREILVTGSPGCEIARPRGRFVRKSEREVNKTK